MDTLAQAIAQHGYTILAAMVFSEAIGLPVPAALALIVSGALSAAGTLKPAFALASAFGAMAAGDMILYMFGRYTGWWFLGLLCRVSLNPEGCILKSASMFYRRGRVVLLFAKFVPGINTLAPPLAGSMNMRFSRFVPLDLAGASVYVSAYWTVGYICRDFLNSIARGYTLFGQYLGRTLGVLFAGYLFYRAWLWFRSRQSGPVRVLRAAEVGQRLGEVAIYDVRSHGYFDRNAVRIRGSIRLDPHSLAKEDCDVARDPEIILYCTCYREATSVRVARNLAERGISAAVIKGGLRAWRKAGLPVEPVPREEVVELPTFV